MNQYEYMILKICRTYVNGDLDPIELCNAIEAILKTQQNESEENEKNS